MSDIELSYYPPPFTPSALFSRHKRKIGYRRFEFSWILLEGLPIWACRSTVIVGLKLITEEFLDSEGKVI